MCTHQRQLAASYAHCLVLQAQAISIGLHQLLLTCVANTHALLALKAFQPSHQPVLAAVAPTPSSALSQAKAAGRLPSHSNKALLKPKGTKGLGRVGLETVKAEANMRPQLDIAGEP